MPRRRVLCVFPRYAPSFGSFEFSYPLTDGVRAFMPPQGLLVIAAAVPPSWQVRFIDENIAPASARRFRLGGGGVRQRHARAAAADRGHPAPRPRARPHRRAGRLLGLGLSRSITRTFDYLHVGELGDATDELFARLSRDAARPSRQVVLTTRERRELTEFPLPAYELAQLKRYFLGSIQFSSGCPYQCEFCDIPALYGRNPRFKTPDQVCAELDKMLACGLSGAVYFVDDNFIAHRARGARAAAASDRMAEAQPLSTIRCRLRGDAQHRQAAGNSRADARGDVRDGLLRHRDARPGGAQGDRRKSTT